MARVLKVLAVVVGGIVVLLVVAGIAVSFFFDPNDYRDEIEQAVENATGRTLSLEGDLKLSIFPWLSVQTGRAQLGNAPGFGEQPFASIDSASASLRLLPLLSKRVEVGTVSLAGLNVNLAVDQNGRSNWQDLAGSETPPSQPAQAEGGGGFDLRSLSVGGIAVTNARVTYDDRQAGVTYRLNDLDLESGPVTPGQLFSLNFQASASSSEPAVDVSLNGKGEFNVDLAGGSYTARNVELDTRLTGEAVPGGAADAQLRLSAASYSGGQVQLAGLQGSALGVDFRGAWSGRLADAGPQGSGELHVAEFNPREVMAKLKLDYQPADAKVLTAASLDTDLTASGGNYNARNLMLRLDDTHVSGSAGLQGAKTVFDLTVDSIDADRYMPPAEDTSASGAGSASAAGSMDDVEIPTDSLRALDMDGQLKVGMARFAGLDFTDVQLAVSASNGQVRLHPLSAALYGGQYQGDVSVDASGATPRLSLNENVNAVQVGQLVQALYGVERVTGQMDAKFKLQAAGANVGAMRRALGGNLSFQVKDGAFEGVDLWYEIRRARALLRQAQPPAAPETRRTRFTEASATATVNQGVLKNDDFLALLPFLRVTGAGTVNLADAMLDYRLVAEVLDKPELADDAAAQDLKGRKIPVTLSGSLTDPSIRPDLQGLLRQEAEKRVREEVQKRVGGELLNRLGGSSGSNDSAPDQSQEQQQDQQQDQEPKPASPEDAIQQGLKRLLSR